MIKPTIIHFKEITSTNDYLKMHADELPHLTIISTDYQTKGRGQFDHVWISNRNENILTSLLIKSINVLSVNDIKTKVIALLKQFFHSFDIHTLFKEPNDLYVNDEKICGILIESSYEAKVLKYVVIGIGININQVDFGGLPATSLKKIKQKTYEISEIKNIFYQLVLKMFE